MIPPSSAIFAERQQGGLATGLDQGPGGLGSSASSATEFQGDLGEFTAPRRLDKETSKALSSVSLSVNLRLDQMGNGLHAPHPALC